MLYGQLLKGLVVLGFVWLNHLWNWVTPQQANKGADIEEHDDDEEEEGEEKEDDEETEEEIKEETDRDDEDIQEEENMKDI